jgi:hypothetical protein
VRSRYTTKLYVSHAAPLRTRSKHGTRERLKQRLSTLAVAGGPIDPFILARANKLTQLTSSRNMGVTVSPPLFKRIFQHHQGARDPYQPKLPRGRRAHSSRILPVTSDDFNPSKLSKKSNLCSPRSAVSLPTSLPNLHLLPRRRRTAVVRFSDVSVRVYQVTTHYCYEVSRNDEVDEDEASSALVEAPFWTLDWDYCDFATRLPINQFEAFHREGAGIRSRTKAQLPKDFERLYRISRSSNSPRSRAA